MAPLKTLEIIDLEINGPASGTITNAQSVGFRAKLGGATILNNQTLGAENFPAINFDALENGEPLPDIAYSVNAASTLLIVGYRYNEV